MSVPSLTVYFLTLKTVFIDVIVFLIILTEKHPLIPKSSQNHKAKQTRKAIMPLISSLSEEGDQSSSTGHRFVRIIKISVTGYHADALGTELLATFLQLNHGGMPHI